jgi:hypothetical protein
MVTPSSETFCPVCGYDLGFLPWKGNSSSDEICPSCGIQFGYTDAAGGNLQRRQAIYQQWRERWIAEGMRWSSKSAPPEDWNPRAQLRNIGVNVDDPAA